MGHRFETSIESLFREEVAKLASKRDGKSRMVTGNQRQQIFEQKLSISAMKTISLNDRMFHNSAGSTYGNSFLMEVYLTISSCVSVRMSRY